MQKILLDSNILVYAFDKSVVFHDSARQILDSDTELYATNSTLYEFYRVMTSKPFQQKFSLENVIQALDFYKQRLNILYPTQVTDYILAELINQHKPKSGQIWDSLVLAQSLENKIDIIYTKNTKHFPTNPIIKIVDPTI